MTYNSTSDIMNISVDSNIITTAKSIFWFVWYSVLCPLINNIDGVEKINVFILISVSFVCPFFHAPDDNLCFH